jgi:hypothetical protein
MSANCLSALDPHAQAFSRACAAAQVGSFVSRLSSAGAESSVSEPQAICAGADALAANSKKTSAID